MYTFFKTKMEKFFAIAQGNVTLKYNSYVQYVHTHPPFHFEHDTWKEERYYMLLLSGKNMYFQRHARKACFIANLKGRGTHKCGRGLLQ